MSANSSGKISNRAPLRLSGEDRKAAILDAAVRLCAERGFHGVTTRDLAAAAGVSEALLFRHFASKDELILEVLGRFGFEDKISKVEACLSGLSPREGLRQIAQFVSAQIPESGSRIRVILYGALEVPDIAHQFYSRFASRMIRLEEGLFERAFAERGLRRNAHLAARSFHGTLVFHTLLACVLRTEPPPPDPERFAQELLELYLPEDGE